METRSLTHSEAQQRAELLTVARYDIDVDLTELPDGPHVRSIAEIAFSCSEPGATTFADCGAEVTTATLNGAPLPPAEHGRIELRDLAAQNVLRVSSVQANTSTGPGVHKAVDPADGQIYLWMSFEPNEAHHVWACFDQPDLKAPHRFTVTAPADWTVLSNSAEPHVEDLGKARRWQFPDTPALSTYNLVINAGPFAELRRTSGGYDLGIYARRSLRPVLERDADEIFTVTDQGLAFFGDVFGMPFPQRVYNQAFVPELGGAMENYGCVTWSDASLRRVPPTPAERVRFAQVLLHEMAHMWFGNIVTMRWWDDLWLNEAFAEFACNWAAVRATRYTDAWATHLASGKLDAYLADQGPASHPIRQPIHDVAQAASIFDAITYPKGASVLLQLMTYVGEDQFSAGLTSYFARHKWGNATLQDLIEAVAAASGRDLNGWRAAWLETAGTDRLALERDNDTAVLTADAPAGNPRPHVVAIGAYRAGDGRLERVDTVRVDTQGSRTPVTLPAETDFFLVNDDDLTFARTRPPVGMDPAAFAAAAMQLPTPTSRGVAVATVWDMLLAGEITAAVVTRSLLGVLSVETADSVIERYLSRAGDAAEFWAPDSERAALTAEVARTCQALAANEDRRRIALRGYARVAPDPAGVAWLRAQAGDDVDLQWRALVRAAELGVDTSREVEDVQGRDPDPDAWVRALTVRAARPDPAAKAAVWQRVAVERTVPIGASFAVAAAFWRPGQHDLLAPYAKEYIDLLPDLDRGGMIPAMSYADALFPTVGIEVGYLQQVEAAAKSAAPVVRKTVVERADEVRRMLRSRGQANGERG